MHSDDAREIAREAFVYAYPLVLMQVTRDVGCNVEVPTGTRAPVNQLSHARTPPDASFTDIVRPNADTLYSVLAYDVADEPIVVIVPDAGGRYYLLQLLDFWSDVFACPGTRTTGEAAQRFAIVGPGWRGTLPDGVRAYRSPTSAGLMIGRTQTNGAADQPAVHRFQDGMSAVPLGVLGKPYVPPRGRVDPTLASDAPSDQVARMDPAVFFARFAELMKDNPPHANDYPILDRLARIGIVPGAPFDLEAAPAVVQDALRAAPARALPSIESAFLRAGREVNGWHLHTSGIGTYGTDYLMRASVAFGGLGANCPEDAVYPAAATDAAGAPLRADRRYVLRFEPGALPPARAFWSLTLYDERQLFAENPLGRYALGDRDALVRDERGALEILVQRDAPAGRESNWLPAPAEGTFTLMLRVYWPASSVLDGTWSPPPLRALPAERDIAAGAARHA